VRANGSKVWYIHGNCVSEEMFNLYKNRTLDSKSVQIDGVKYKLTAE
jgi:hypothetical protein